MRNMSLFLMLVLSSTAQAETALDALKSFNQGIIAQATVFKVPKSVSYIGTTDEGQVCEVLITPETIIMAETQEAKIVADDAFNPIYGNPYMQDQAKLLIKPDLESNTLEVKVASELDKSMAHFKVRFDHNGFASGRFEKHRGSGVQTCEARLQSANFKHQDYVLSPRKN